MIEAAEVKPGDHVLEVGTGSGYAAAVMSHIANRVYTIERHPALAETARRRFGKLGYDNIELRVGDGSKGWPAAAPFSSTGRELHMSQPRVVASNPGIADRSFCAQCGAEMQPEHFEPEAPGVELRTFRCHRCGHKETKITKPEDSDI